MHEFSGFIWSQRNTVYKSIIHFGLKSVLFRLYGSLLFKNLSKHFSHEYAMRKKYFGSRHVIKRQVRRLYDYSPIYKVAREWHLDCQSVTPFVTWKCALPIWLRSNLNICHICFCKEILEQSCVFLLKQSSERDFHLWPGRPAWFWLNNSRIFLWTLQQLVLQSITFHLILHLLNRF